MKKLAVLFLFTCLFCAVLMLYIISAGQRNHNIIYLSNVRKENAPAVLKLGNLDGSGPCRYIQERFTLLISEES